MRFARVYCQGFYTKENSLKIQGRANPVESVLLNKPDDICCLLYTSGSTGIPKGAIISDDVWNRTLQIHYMPQDPMVFK